jgi:hypothetical protein
MLATKSSDTTRKSRFMVISSSSKEMVLDYGWFVLGAYGD